MGTYGWCVHGNIETHVLHLQPGCTHACSQLCSSCLACGRSRYNGGPTERVVPLLAATTQACAPALIRSAMDCQRSCNVVSLKLGPRLQEMCVLASERARLRSCPPRPRPRCPTLNSVTKVPSYRLPATGVASASPAAPSPPLAQGPSYALSRKIGMRDPPPPLHSRSICQLHKCRRELHRG